MTIASAATEPPASQSAGGGCNHKRRGVHRIAPSLALITTLQTLLSITCHGPMCPNRRMRPNLIEILLTWSLGLALNLIPPLNPIITINTLMRSNTSPWTVNWRRSANVAPTASSPCDLRSTPTWHSFVRMCCGYLGSTWMLNRSHLGKYPSIEILTLSKGWRSRKCRRSIHPPPSWSRVYPVGHARSCLNELLCNHHLLVDLVLI